MSKHNILSNKMNPYLLKAKYMFIIRISSSLEFNASLFARENKGVDVNTKHKQI